MEEVSDEPLYRDRVCGIDITDTDIPDFLHPSAALPDDDWPGQYL